MKTQPVERRREKTGRKKRTNGGAVTGEQSRGGGWSKNG